MYCLVFSETRTVPVIQFCGQHLWYLVLHRRNTLVWREVPVEDILRGGWCCCEIDASGSVSSPRRWRLVASVEDTVDYTQHSAGHLAEMQGCGCTLLAYVIMVTGTHVVGGDGYPRWHKSVVRFFQQQLLLHYWMAWIDHGGMHRMHVHWACLRH